MKVEEFNQSKEMVSEQYRAVCESSRRHWKGTWKTEYHEAVADAQNHLKGNELHEVWIELKTHVKALFK